MRTKTTAALALAGAALAAPVAAAQQADAPPPPLRAPLAGHATVASQMREAGRAERREDRIIRERRERREARQEAREAAAAVPPALEAIAACESGGDPATNTGNGFYGKYQFTLATWTSVGGTGNPAAAPEAEQDQRAAILYAREGAAPWPVCGR